MKQILNHPTSMAQWLSLVHEAELSCHVRLQEDIESYLVFLLMRYTTRPELATSVLGLEFLNATQQESHRQQQLKDVGDKCLLVSGLFPGRAEKKRVSLSYFVKLGKTAYFNFSITQNNGLSSLFNELSQTFILLRDVLHSIRTLSNESQGLDIWQALDLWQETQSPLAKQTLETQNPELIVASRYSVGKH